MKSWMTALVAALTLAAAGRAPAHVTVFADHHAEQPLEKALSLPNIEALWAVNGFLSKPGQVDYITFTADQGERFLGMVFNPLKTGAREFRPSFALIGPGLPAVTGEVPFTVPAGSGAQIFTTPESLEVSDEQLGYGAMLEGPMNEVTLPAAGRYYVAVWDPEGKSGHYVISIGESEDETLVPDIEKYTIPRFGDVNEDGQVSAEDALVVLEILANNAPMTARQRFAADIGPAGDSNAQISPGDGVIDAADALRILRRALGLDTGEAWPF